MSIPNTAIRKSVKDWINHVVIGHNFCPFAQQEVLNRTIHYQISEHIDAKQALTELIDYLHMLENQPQLSTGFIIYPTGFADFGQYLDLLEQGNGLLEQAGYSGIFQIASFHPHYCFEGAQEDDPANYTNRSPFPMLHILREKQLSAALAHYPDVDAIPQNNIDKAQSLGIKALKQDLKKCMQGLSEGA